MHIVHMGNSIVSPLPGVKITFFFKEIEAPNYFDRSFLPYLKYTEVCSLTSQLIRRTEGPLTPLLPNQPSL